uniref:Uncharacterized protein n=1 Tax=Plectus sambesii TaxID=2011161 RepID=A0A914WL21_9BILA
MDQPVRIHPNLEILFPPNNLSPSGDADLKQSEGGDRLPLISAPAPTAHTSAPSSPSHNQQNNGFDATNNSYFNPLNFPGSLSPLGPLLYPGVMLPGSMRPRMPSAMDFFASGLGQQPPMFPMWTAPMAADLSRQMLFARNLAIVAAQSNLLAQSQSAMSGGMTMQQLASAMGLPQTCPSLTKAEALVCGPSSNNRADFELPFYAQSSTKRRSDDFVRHVDDAATATALAMLEDNRRCTASEPLATVQKMTPDSKNLKRQPASINAKKATSIIGNRSDAHDVRRMSFEQRGDHEQRDRAVPRSTTHSPGPSGDSTVVARDSPRAPSRVVSVQPTDASGGGMLVSRRSDDGHLDVRV